MNLFQLAARNVARNRQRTAVTVLAMAFAGFIMILFAALMEGMLRTSERNAVTMDVGDFQIHLPGYRDDPDLYKRITSTGEILEKLEEAGYLASPRLYGFSLAASGSASAGIQLRGIEVSRESRVTQIHRHLMKGIWLDEGDSHGVVIGKKLARTLNVDLGDEVILVGQAADGSMANDLYQVRGILKTVGEGLDRSGFFMTASAFRQLMVIDNGAHEIAVMRPDRSADLEIATEEIKTLVPDHEVLNWRELRPVIARILDMADTQLIVMILITYIAVAMVVLNAMLMGVFERLRQFGIMKAIGVTPFQIMALVALETLFQVTAAALLALGTGWYAADYYRVHGIDLSNLAESASFAGVAFDPIWVAYVTKEALITPIVFLYVMAFFAVLYPAAKAALIDPVRAIHHR